MTVQITSQNSLKYFLDILCGYFCIPSLLGGEHSAGFKKPVGLAGTGTGLGVIFLTLLHQ